MKAFLAYTLLVLGIPMYVGVIASALFMPLAWAFDYPARLSVIQLLNFPKGAISIFVARCMFYLLGVPPHWTILVIALVWISVYYELCKQPRLGWISFASGLVVGWCVTPL